jgi:D-alanyl-D-alanine carboxypeptidase
MRVLPLRLAAGGALVLVAALALPASLGAATSTEQARRKVLRVIEADLAANPTVPGEAVAVRAPGLSLAVAAGSADVANDVPLKANTPFRIASVTKTFVAAAVLRLVEQHRLRLGDPITKHLPPETLALLRADGYRPRDITVRQLLRHTAGLFDYATSPEYDELNTSDPAHHWTAAEQLAFATEHGDPIAAPGERFHYSDTGYVLLGQIIERTTGEPLPAAVRRLLRFRKLGLDHTWWEQYEAPPAGAGERAHQYAGEFDNVALDASSDLYGGGGLVSTVSDLTRFFRALFHGKVVGERLLHTMTEVPRAGRERGAGMGIYRVDLDGERCYEHPGYWGTEAIHCPRLDLTIARTTNQAYGNGFDSGALEGVVADLARSSRE